MVHSNFQMTYKLSFWHNYIDVYILFAGIPVPFEISPLLGGLIGVVTALLFITIAIPIAMKIRNERRTQRPSDLPLKKSTAPSSEDLYDTEDRNPDVVPINKGIYTRIYIILCETYQLMGDRMWYAHLCYCKYFFFFFFFFFFFYLSRVNTHCRPVPITSDPTGFIGVYEHMQYMTTRIWSRQPVSPQRARKHERRKRGSLVCNQ